MSESREFAYDIALSFAGEERPYVAAVAAGISAAGVRVFYDEYEAATLWGKNLYEHLRDVYQSQARYTVVFVSENYAKKVWTNHERQSAQARAIKEHSEYILPARFDDTILPGLLDTTGYVDLRSTTPEQLVALTLQKLGRRPGSWEGPALPSLPGDTQPKQESLRERAARLAAQSQVRERREQFLGSTRGVELARKEVGKLFEYVRQEVAALKEADPTLTIYYQKDHQRVHFVRSPRASFTMYWSQTYGNSLTGASLFTREFDGPHSPESFGPRRKPSRETHVDFDVDEELSARWRDEDQPEIALTTQQLADRYLSRVIERAYAPDELADQEDLDEGDEDAF